LVDESATGSAESWSHLPRRPGSGPQEAFGLDGLEVTWNVFQAWKQFQDDGDRAALQRRVEAAEAQLWPLLEWGSRGSDCRLQRRSLYSYLGDALAAKARGDPVPTLT
jgi:hypothetical protein